MPGKNAAPITAIASEASDNRRTVDRIIYIEKLYIYKNRLAKAFYRE
jgi:hypothetical protein